MANTHYPPDQSTDRTFHNPMPARLDISISSLRAFMRAAPPLHPEDSIGRFIKSCRQYACTSLPVERGNRFCGIVRERDVLPLLQQENPSDVEAILRRPLSDVMRDPDVIVRPAMSPEDVRSLFRHHNLDLMQALPVVDEEGYCLGIVVYNDLLAAEGPVCRMDSVGGMATPFGVYLTDGTVQAGASNWALVTSGIVIGTLLLIAASSVDYALQWIQKFVTLPHGSELLDISDISTRLPPAVSILGLALKIVMYLAFFALLRVTSIAGYHAAEHQTVHALERNEPLVAEIVRRMPRPHPRCGTNIMGIGLLLFTLCPLAVSLLHLDLENAIALAAILTFFTWRKFGTFLQAYFTTRPASDRQLASGIDAGRALLGTFYTSTPVRSTLLRRIWCMGILQNMLGVALVSGAYTLFTLVATKISHR